MQGQIIVKHQLLLDYLYAITYFGSSSSSRCVRMQYTVSLSAATWLGSAATL
jgi:hypothetical protein